MRSAVHSDRAAWLAERRRNQVARFDRLFAATYDERWGRIDAGHARFVERFLALCPPDGSILDAACGTGKYWTMVLDSGRRPSGIDQSAGMLIRAAAKFPEVPVEVRALTDLDADAAFDGVMCVDAMEYVPPEEWPPVLAAFRRSLRDGGLLYVTVEQIDPAEIEAENRRSRDQGHPVVAGESVQGQAPEEDDGYHFYPDEPRVRGWLAAAGFVLIDREVADGYLHVLARREASTRAIRARATRGNRRASPST